MKALWISALFALLPVQQALGWGPEGHSIIAEIAQRQVTDHTRKEINKIFDDAGYPGGTLASVASWADAVKYTEEFSYTRPWHYVGIPLKQSTYKFSDCTDEKTPELGDDCIVAALEKLKTQLACEKDPQIKFNDLRFVVHLVGDSTQPLHTVKDFEAGHEVMVKIDFCGLKNKHCKLPQELPSVTFHALWDSTLINDTVYAWGSYVDRLYKKTGWLTKTAPDPAGDTIIGWVNDTHTRAQMVWTKLLPSNRVINQKYYDQVLPILDRQLAIGGLRLARYLDEVLAPNACPTRIEPHRGTMR
jgi:hypothetical protein